MSLGHNHGGASGGGQVQWPPGTSWESGYWSWAWGGSAAPRCRTPRTPTCCSSTTHARCGRRGRHQAGDRGGQRVAPPAVASVTRSRSWSIDADLRPEGRNGPMSRSLASYRAYYQRWSAPWEAQALLRARPISGDPGLGEEFLAHHRPAALPGGRAAGGPPARHASAEGADGVGAAAPRRRIPQCTPNSAPAGCRMSSGRCSCCRCSTPIGCPQLRTTQTFPALAAAVDAGLLDAGDAEELRARLDDRDPNPQRDRAGHRQGGRPGPQGLHGARDRGAPAGLRTR